MPKLGLSLPSSSWPQLIIFCMELLPLQTSFFQPGVHDWQHLSTVHNTVVFYLTLGEAKQTRFPSFFKFFQINFVALIVSARGLLEVVLVQLHFVCKAYSMTHAKNQSWPRSFSQHHRDLAKGLTGAGVRGNLWWLFSPTGAPAHLANPKLPVLNFRDQLWCKHGTSNCILWAFP